MNSIPWNNGSLLFDRRVGRLGAGRFRWELLVVKEDVRVHLRLEELPFFLTRNANTDSNRNLGPRIIRDRENARDSSDISPLRIGIGLNSAFLIYLHLADVFFLHPKVDFEIGQVGHIT